MADNPTQLVVMAFDDEGAADEALKGLKEAKRERLIGIESAAVLRKDEDGKLKIKETADMGGAKGAAIGGVLGAGIGALAGATLAAPLVIGGLIGGLAAKLADGGFDDSRLKRLGESLTPGSSAIVALVEHRWVDEVRSIAAETAKDVLAEDLAAGIAAELESHHDAAYTALLEDGSLTAGAVAADEDDVEGAVANVSADGVAAGAFVATDEGVTVAGDAPAEEEEAESDDQAQD